MSKLKRRKIKKWMSKKGPSWQLHSGPLVLEGPLHRPLASPSTVSVQLKFPTEFVGTKFCSGSWHARNFGNHYHFISISEQRLISNNLLGTSLHTDWPLNLPCTKNMPTRSRLVSRIFCSDTGHSESSRAYTCFPIRNYYWNAAKNFPCPQSFVRVS